MQNDRVRLHYVGVEHREFVKLNNEEFLHTIQVCKIFAVEPAIHMNIFGIDEAVERDPDSKNLDISETFDLSRSTPIFVQHNLYPHQMF